MTLRSGHVAGSCRRCSHTCCQAYWWLRSPNRKPFQGWLAAISPNRRRGPPVADDRAEPGGHLAAIGSAQPQWLDQKILVRHGRQAMAEHLAGACGGALRQAHGEAPSGRRSGGTQQRPGRGRPKARGEAPCRLSPTVKAVDGRRPPGGRPGSHGLSRPARDRQRARPTWAGPGQGRPEAPPSHRQALARPGTRAGFRGCWGASTQAPRRRRPCCTIRQSV